MQNSQPLPTAASDASIMLFMAGVIKSVSGYAGGTKETAIYYHDDLQKSAAETSKKALDASGRFKEPIVTEILPFSTFFPAEEEHQNFAQKRAEYYARYKEDSGRAGFIAENCEKP